MTSSTNNQLECCVVGWDAVGGGLQLRYFRIPHIDVVGPFMVRVKFVAFFFSQTSSMSSMTAAEEAQTLLSSVEIDEERFVGLLTNLIDNVATLQNNPSQVCCLREKRAESIV